MLNTTIQVKTDFFDGPLALLLHLIQEQEMDIRQLDLTVITRQYLDYLNQIKELNFDLAGDYLYLAATLIWLKSRSCVEGPLSDEDIPEVVEEMGITSQEELIRRLLELQRFQQLGKKLWELPKKGHEIFCKPKVDRKSIIDSILTPLELNQLTEVMIDYFKRSARAFKVVSKEKISIQEKLLFLKGYLKQGENYDFDTVLRQDGEMCVENIIVTFISFLELARLGLVQVFQNEEDSKLYIHVQESLETFNLDNANGFANPQQEEQKELAKTLEPTAAPPPPEGGSDQYH
jgi:segregation and condensation protein A